MEQSEFVQTIETLHADARRRGLYFQVCDDADPRGRTVELGGRTMTWFGSCSYLGLDHHPALVESACEMVRRYGTQFASSRGYVSAPPYAELEARLAQMLGGTALVGQTTTLAHMAAFDVLATEKDAVVLDHQVHASVQKAATLARSAGATVEIVRHDALDQAFDVVARLARKHRHVLFCCDGVTSMYGELVSIDFLRALLDVAPNVRLYVDDAHGLSWAGRHGRGLFLDRMPRDPRVVVATSLAKAFAAGGGVLLFADPDEARRVRLAGSTMVFSGPLQPALLGAAVASARLHLSDEIGVLQAQLAARVAHLNRGLRAAGLPLLVENDAPVFFLCLGLPRAACEVAERVARDGWFVNVAMYPSVPMKRAGVRIALTAEHTFDEIDGLVASLARHVPAVLAESGLAAADVVAQFGQARPDPGPARNGGRLLESLLEIAPAAPANRPPMAAPEPEPDADGLVLEHARSILEVDRAEWDRLLGSQAHVSWESLRMQEALFRDQPRPEHDWACHYLIVRDATGRPLAATVCTDLLNKDDMLMREEVSAAVEARRAQEPYFLTSRTLMTGTGFSEGEHLYLDRTGPWRAALRRLLGAIDGIWEATGAAMILLRDVSTDDLELAEALRDEGFAPVAMPDTHWLTLDFETEADLLLPLPRRKRKHLRELVERSAQFSMATWGARHDHYLPPAECARLFDLYRQVARRGLRINTFELPPGFVDAVQRSPAWEVVTLHLDVAAGGPEDGRPVAWFAAHVHGTSYAGLVCGLDYAYVHQHGAYRQMLLHSIRRARQNGAKAVQLGMDAAVEKRRFGAQPMARSAFVRVRDDYQGAVLRDVVERLGLAARIRAA